MSALGQILNQQLTAGCGRPVPRLGRVPQLALGKVSPESIPPAMSIRNTLRFLAVGCVVAALGACGGSGGAADNTPARLKPTATVSLWHSDLVFDATRQSLYAVVGNDSSSPPKIVAIAAASGQVQDLVAPSDPPLYAPVDPVQGTLSLSAQAQYLYFTTAGGAVSRVNLTAKTVDLTVPAPTASNAKVAAAAASRTDDSTAYGQLVSNGSDPDSIGVLRNAQWGTAWVQVPRHPGVAATLAVRSDDAELLSRASALQRVGIGANGPDTVLETGTIPSSSSPDVPQYVSAGALAQGRIYEATSLVLLFEVPGASVCGVLPNRSRLVCAAPAASTGHELFVFDLPTRSRVASWLAGFDTGTVFVTTPALRVTPIGTGRVAVSYGSATKLATYGPNALAIYSDAAFN